MTSAATVKRALATALVGAGLVIGYYGWSLKDGVAAGQQDVWPPPPAQAATVPSVPAAATRPQAATPAVDSSAAGTTIAFAPGSARLGPEAMRSLISVFSHLSSTTVTKVQICGYTDDRGDPVTNLNLSIQRARTVADHLITLGITRDRLVMQGFGSTRPIADNATDDGRLRNNRVEITEINARP